MIATQTFDAFPEFGNTATKTKPDDAKYAAGMQEADVLPAEWLNWFWSHSSKGVTDLNTGLLAVEQELNAILTAGGEVPSGTSGQVLTAIQYLIQAKTGDLVNLQTTTKTNIVAAVNEILSALNSHKNNTSNPHGVTKAQIGLEDTPNMSAQAIFNMCHPVGEKYFQYPGDANPNDLYNQNGIQSTWTNISSHFAGLSMRIEGGNAETFNKQLIIQSKSGNQITFTAPHNLTMGSLIVNAETYTQYSVASVDSTTEVTLNETPVDLLNNTTVLILQNSGLPNIKGSFHSEYQGSGYYGIANNFSGAFNDEGFEYRSNPSHGSTFWLSEGVNFNASRYNPIYSDNCNEVRTPNTTIRLWKRTA